MRRLAGRQADGWISGGLRVTDVPAELAHGNPVIDEAARVAGRDPSEIRRLSEFASTSGPNGRGFVQGPPQRWARQLLPLVIDYGSACSSWSGDDPRLTGRWGGEVAPPFARRSRASNRDGLIIRPGQRR